MGLSEYRRKRDLSKTPEPRGEVVEEQRKSPPLRFVVQKHAARRLHYDFRLEMDGVLKCWALPIGPSLDPGVKRLAVQVEDHPLEYADFEGVIPEGEYGAGTVLIWDRGTWVTERDPVKAFEHGALKFELRGERLRGGWALVHMGRRRSGNYWLLIKQRDAESRPGSGDAVVAHNLTTWQPGATSRPSRRREIACGGEL
jgi:bifunctional non-homologous end joining protein LigD